jgi:peptide/nickel transport system ATP-binding protein
MDATPHLSVRDLRITTSAGQAIIEGISFSLQSGETLGIVGESGCGKTTLALALLGKFRRGTLLSKGEIAVAGRDIARMGSPELRAVRGRTISYVAQNPSTALSPRMRVGDQLAETLRVHGFQTADAARRIDWLLEQVVLPTGAEFKRRYPFELSGGQQQRIAIAMALACDPIVVVLDEPTTGLDVSTQSQVLALIRDLKARLNMSFVYISHDLAVVDNLADRVMVLYAGRMAEIGDRRTLFASPRHPYTRLLLRSVPQMGQRLGIVGIAGSPPVPGDRPPGCAFAPRCPDAIQRCQGSVPPLDPVGATPARAAHEVACWNVTAASAIAPAVPALGAAVAAREGQDALLEVRSLGASYPADRSKPILSDVSLALSQGECVALVGESGSGKSTLARCIVGLHRPDTGVVSLRGVPLGPTAAARDRSQLREIQIVFQNPDRSLNPRETVAAAIQRPLRLFERSPGDARIVESLLDRVKLSARYMHRYPAELSGGEKQRVAIARALAAEPRILVCDEITSALDVSTQGAVIDLLQDLQRQTRLALLFITHNLALVGEATDRVLVLNRGQICESGESLQTIRNPRHPYTKALVAATPVIGARSGS